MNLNIMYEHLSKLEIIVYNKKFNAERSKIPAGIFLKTFSGIPEREFLVALSKTESNGRFNVNTDWMTSESIHCVLKFFSTYTAFPCVKQQSTTRSTDDILSC